MKSEASITDHRELPESVISVDFVTQRRHGTDISEVTSKAKLDMATGNIVDLESPDDHRYAAESHIGWRIRFDGADLPGASPDGSSFVVGRTHWAAFCARSERSKSDSRKMAESQSREDGLDYRVRIEVSITADSPEQAAAFALDDLRDLSLGPLNFDVENLESGNVKMVSAGSPLTPWERDDVQFPRLLAEIMATQDKLDIRALAESMDLTIEEVNLLFDRADKAWDAIKPETVEVQRY